MFILFILGKMSLIFKLTRFSRLNIWFEAGLDSRIFPSISKRKTGAGLSSAKSAIDLSFSSTLLISGAFLIAKQSGETSH